MVLSCFLILMLQNITCHYIVPFFGMNVWYIIDVMYHNVFLFFICLFIFLKNPFSSQGRPDAFWVSIQHMTGRVLAMRYWMCHPCRWNHLPLCPALSPATKSRPAASVSAPMVQMGVGSTVFGAWLCSRWEATHTYHLPDRPHQLLSQVATVRSKCQEFAI